MVRKGLSKNVTFKVRFENEKKRPPSKKHREDRSRERD